MSGADLNSALSDKAKRDALIREQQVAALRREHEAMTRHGRKDRAKLVEAELRDLGVTVKAEPESAPADGAEVEAQAEPESAPVKASRARSTTRA